MDRCTERQSENRQIGVRKDHLSLNKVRWANCKATCFLKNTRFRYCIHYNKIFVPFFKITSSGFSFKPIYLNCMERGVFRFLNKIKVKKLQQFVF